MAAVRKQPMCEADAAVIRDLYDALDRYRDEAMAWRRYVRNNNLPIIALCDVNERIEREEAARG